MAQANGVRGVNPELLAKRLLECSTIGGAEDADPFRKMAVLGFVQSLTMDQQLLLTVLVSDMEHNIEAYKASMGELSENCREWRDGMEELARQGVAVRPRLSQGQLPVQSPDPVKDWNDDAVAVLGSVLPQAVPPAPSAPSTLDPAAEAALRTAQIRAELAQRSGKVNGDVDAIYAAATHAAEAVVVAAAQPQASLESSIVEKPLPAAATRRSRKAQRIVAVHKDGTAEEVDSESEAYAALGARS